MRNYFSCLKVLQIFSYNIFNLKSIIQDSLCYFPKKLSLSYLQQNNMKALKFQSRLRQDLTKNYEICTALIKGEEPLPYEQMIYAIHNKRISLKQIMYFKAKKYKKQPPPLRRTFIIADAVQLNGEVVGKAWRFSKTIDQERNSLQKSRIKQKSARKNNVDPQFFTEGISKGENRSNGKKQNKKNSTEQSRAEKNEGSEQKIDINKETIEVNEENKKQNLVDYKNNPKQRFSNPQIPKKSQFKSPKKQTEEEKQAIRNKIEDIQNQMEFMQAELNSTRNEEQAAKIQKKYGKLAKQLLALRNRKRLLKEKNELEKIEEEAAEIPPKILQMIDNMNEIRAQNSKILNKQEQFNEKITKTEEINRLKMVFKVYAKMQSTSHIKYFSDLQADVDSLPIDIFIKFAKDWNLGRILSMEQINKIFKHRSKGKKSIEFGQFHDILNDIHNHECIKQEKEFNAASLSGYLQNYIVSDQKMDKIRNKGPRVKSQSYEYKPRSHSGKYLQDIQAELKEKKIKLNFLACEQNIAVIKDKIKESERKNQHFIPYNQEKIKSINNSSTIMKQTEYLLNESSNSYAFRFKSKKNSQPANLRMRMRTEAVTSAFRRQKEEQSIRNQFQNRQNTLQVINDKNRTLQTEEVPQGSYLEDGIIFTNHSEAEMKRRKRIERDPNFEQFEDLIELSEEDEYLNKHLMLPPIHNQNKGRKKLIHF